MRRSVFLSLILGLLMTCLVNPALGAQSPVVAKNTSMKLSGRTIQVKALYINLRDWEVRPVLAKNTVGATESLASMAARSGAEAAINGTFFNSYTDMQPHGTVEIEGMMAHTGTKGTTMGLTLDNKIIMENLFVGIEGSINDSYEWPNNWYAWGINHVYADPSAISVITSAKGKSAGSQNVTSIVVKKGVVVDIRRGVVGVPIDGFVITANSGTGAQQIAARFKLGDRVGYRYVYKQGNNKGPVVNWGQVRHALGAGPRLLTAGKVTVDFQKEGVSDPKLTTYRSLRSFIGNDKYGNLVMGTANSVTVKELALVAQKLGLMEAMNMDGGASAGLYQSGKYLTTPGRLLSNSLVIVKRTTPIIKAPSSSELAYKYYLEGKALQQSGNPSGAKAKYLAALQLNAKLTDCYLRLGQISQNAQELTQAVAYYESAIQLNPKDPMPYEKIAWIYYGQQKYPEARLTFGRLAAADAKSQAKAYYGIGLTYSAWQVKEYGLAKEYFQKAIMVDPNGTYGKLAREQMAKLLN